MSLIKTTLSIIIALCFSTAQAARFQITNQCSYNVWAAAIPVGGGRQLNRGDSWSLDVPPKTANARIWGRTGCNFDGSGNGGCQTGDCGGRLVCILSGRPPTTLAEFNLNTGTNGNQDFYDLSVIDGFNVPMAFNPTSNGCRRLTCAADKCPDAYLFPNDNSKTHPCPSGTDYGVVFCP